MSLWGNMTESVLAKMKSEAPMSENEFFESEIALWKRSEKRKAMIDGERYFRGEHDILKSERTVIGGDGRLKTVKNLPNNRIVDNQYQRAVNQKVNYLLGREAMWDGENKVYTKLLEKTLGRGFWRLLKCVLRDAINMGIGWIYVYTDECGKLRMKRIPAYEMIAYWEDDEHTRLDCAVRLYGVEGYRGKKECVREMAEIYRKDRVEVYEIEDGVLKKTEEHGYFKDGDIPLVAFKYNEKEIPLIVRVKTLQDALNRTVSDFRNNMQEDARNTILVLQNYDGTDLGEFRQNLTEYGAVKVKTVDGAAGDVRTLKCEFDAEKYVAAVNMLKEAIVENAMGYDAKNDKLGNNPNQLAMKAMLSDLDLDISEAETEFRYGCECIREIANCYLEMFGYGYFEEEKAEVVFNKDCMINETEAIENCVKSSELLSEETLLLMHPWVNDVEKEKQRRTERK